MASLFKYIYKRIVETENNLLNNLLQRISPGQLAPALINLPQKRNVNDENFSLNKLLENSILWAVPKKRRSVQKNRSRKFGLPEYVYKILLPNTNILVCKYCKGYYEANTLCGNCYKRVMDETKAMQDRIQEELGLSPVDKEVVVLYEEENNPEFWKGKRVVEMKKPRPSFFSQNLLQKSTQSNAESAEVQETIQPLKTVKE